MHTPSLIPSVIGTKINPVICPTADQFGLLTGHAGLVATEFSYRKDEEIYGEDEPAEYVYQVIPGGLFGPTNCFPMDGVRLEHFICRTTSSDWNRALATGLRPKPLLIPRFAL